MLHTAQLSVVTQVNTINIVCASYSPTKCRYTAAHIPSRSTLALLAPIKYTCFSFHTSLSLPTNRLLPSSHYESFRKRRNAIIVVFTLFKLWRHRGESGQLFSLRLIDPSHAQNISLPKTLSPPQVFFISFYTSSSPKALRSLENGALGLPSLRVYSGTNDISFSPSPHYFITHQQSGIPVFVMGNLYIVEGVS